VAEDFPFKKTYRLTLDVETSINTRVWSTAEEDARRDEDAGFALEAQRVLLEALLGPYRPILEQWIRQFVLSQFSEAQGTSSADIAAALNQRLLEEEALLEPVIQRLPEEVRDYFLIAMDDGVCRSDRGYLVQCGCRLEACDASRGGAKGGGAGLARGCGCGS
jgi:hypothetical protein